MIRCVSKKQLQSAAPKSSEGVCRKSFNFRGRIGPITSREVMLNVKKSGRFRLVVMKEGEPLLQDIMNEECYKRRHGRDLWTQLLMDFTWVYH